MRVTLLILLFVAFAEQLYSQTITDESAVLKLSASIFRWEVMDKMDSLEAILHEKLIVVNSAGQTQTKQQYMARLKSGSFIHENIEVEESTAAVSDNTAIIYGKGKFYVIVSGSKAEIHLAYMEVFTRKNTNAKWYLVALKANNL